MKMNLDNYLADLRALVNIDCGTYTLSGIEQVADFMEKKYQTLPNFVSKRVDCGKAGVGLEVRNQADNGAIDILLIGHMDTVFPVGTVAKRPFSLDEAANRAYGPGVSDMKSGLLGIFYALQQLEPALRDKLSICVCMNPDEETGSLDSSEWIAQCAKQARVVLVAECARADGSLVKARKGVAGYKLELHGKAAHAGNDPQNGRSAIAELAHWILATTQMNDFEQGTTVNVGVINGGSSVNVVAEYASALIDVRFWDNDEYAKIDAKLNALSQAPFTPDIKVSLTREAYKPAMTPSAQTEQLMSLVEQAGQELALPITWQAVGGGSDANLCAVLGVPTLDGFGPIGGALHSDAEWLQLDSIEPRVTLLRRVIEKIATA
ncbi:MAG: M20 family metallopeptidase [Enterovibrio sp.]